MSAFVDVRLRLTDTDVARLTRPERERRVEALSRRARALLDEGIERHGNGGRRTVGPVALLFSGGNDSTVLAHLFRGRATHAIHANTGIGIEETRQFVRDTCAAWELPLLEKHVPAGSTYREYVLKRGFPGPAQHYRMYQRLKERCLDAARHDLGIANKRKTGGIFVAGRRRDESKRRANIPLFEPDGSIQWVSPIAEWTKLDLNTYRLIHPDVPRNEVADLLHMSGECLCGAYAKQGELEQIGEWFPLTWTEIKALEAEIADRDDIPEYAKRWGWGAYRDPVMLRLQGKKPRKPPKVGRLCSSCAVEYPTLFEVGA